jgi:hypothetical protein
MIFGFNTDVKNGDTVYHVQTEAHRASHSFLSTVFVRGQCIGKKITPYEDVTEDEQSDQHLHELLKEQHRQVVEAVRQGEMGDLLKPVPGEAPSDFL